jgi:hypothetical protein
MIYFVVGLVVGANLGFVMSAMMKMAAEDWQ